MADSIQEILSLKKGHTELVALLVEKTIGDE